MSAAAADPPAAGGAVPSTVSTASTASPKRVEQAYVAVTLFAEIVLLVVLAKLVPRLIYGGTGESLSVWAVAGTVALGFAVSRWLGNPALTTGQRFWRGLAVTLIALQIIGSVDLSESARIWDMSWLLELGRPSSLVWRQEVMLENGELLAGEIDQLFAALMLIPLWFRGVALGSTDLMERPYSNYALVGLFLLAISLALADNAGIESHVRPLAIVWVVSGLLAVALKNAANSDQVQGLGLTQTGASIAATLAALVLGVVLFLLIVTGLVGLIAGSGVVEPVLDAIGTVLRAIITGFTYLLYPLFWLFEQIRDALAATAPEQIEQIGEGIGRPLDDVEAEETESDPTAGIVVARVFGAIGAVLVFAVLAFLLFRRLVKRESRQEEERESLWGEADVMGDLLSGLRGLRARFSRSRDAHSADAPIAELYFDVLDHAEGKGQIRAVHRTPLQFADALERVYGSPTPKRISTAFSNFRYGGRPPNEAEFNSMKQSWDSLKDRPS